MMFNTKTILDAFKSMDVADAPENLCHSQYLEHCAKLLGYNTTTNISNRTWRALRKIELATSTPV